MSEFCSDLQYRIHTTSLTTSSFGSTPPPPSVWTSYVHRPLVVIQRVGQGILKCITLTVQLLRKQRRNLTANPSRWRNSQIGSDFAKIELAKKRRRRRRRRELKSVECGFWKSSRSLPWFGYSFGTSRNLAEQPWESLVMGHFGRMNVSVVDGEEMRGESG